MVLQVDFPRGVYSVLSRRQSSPWPTFHTLFYDQLFFLAYVCTMLTTVTFFSAPPARQVINHMKSSGDVVTLRLASAVDLGDCKGDEPFLRPNVAATKLAATH
jgi:hypothetical protein